MAHSFGLKVIAVSLDQEIPMLSLLTLLLCLSLCREAILTTVPPVFTVFSQWRPNIKLDFAACDKVIVNITCPVLEHARSLEVNLLRWKNSTFEHTMLASYSCQAKIGADVVVELPLGCAGRYHVKVSFAPLVECDEFCENEVPGPHWLLGHSCGPHHPGWCGSLKVLPPNLNSCPGSNRGCTIGNVPIPATITTTTTTTSTELESSKSAPSAVDSQSTKKPVLEMELISANCSSAEFKVACKSQQVSINITFFLKLKTKLHSVTNFLIHCSPESSPNRMIGRPVRIPLPCHGLYLVKGVMPRWLIGGTKCTDSLPPIECSREVHPVDSCRALCPSKSEYYRLVKIGIIIAVVLAIFVLVFGFFCFRRKRNTRILSGSPSHSCVLMSDTVSQTM